MQPWLSALSQSIQAQGHRQVIWLAGDTHWAWQLVNPWLANFKNNIYVGQTDLKHAYLTCCKASKPSTLLGFESSNVVFDAHHGLFPDALTAISGTILPGGFLFFLTPALTDYPSYADDFAKARTSLGFESQCNNRHTVARLIHCAAQHGIYILEQDKPANNLDILSNLKPPISQLPVTQSTPTSSITPSTEQLQLFEHISADLETCNFTSQQLHIIIADRGRGKSHLLGMLAKAVINVNKDNGIKCYLCAPNKAATHSVYKHLNHTEQQALHFVAPENLSAVAGKHDIVFIDEAASLPIGQLIQWSTWFQHLIMATTTHGYEGTGKGFQIRFFEHLTTLAQQCLLNWQQHQLSQPVRYQVNDPIENWLFDAFCLDSEPSALGFTHSTIQQAIPSLQCHYLSQQQLARSDLLKPIFALLVQAHYQTKPSDLRDLLDAPGMHLFAQTITITNQQHVVSVCLVNDEGPIVNTTSSHGALHQDILNGYRRPQGHLLPQVITHHIGEPFALQLKGARIVRIATLDNSKRLGLATGLLDTVKTHYLKHRYDYLGSSFADTADVRAFWLKNQFHYIRQGNKQDKASGTQSALVIYGLSGSGRQLQASTQAFYGRNQLPIATPQDLTQQEVTLLNAFLNHNGSYQSAKHILKRIVGFDITLPKKPSKPLKLAIQDWLIQQGHLQANPATQPQLPT